MLTSEQIIEIITDNDPDVETEHRKYASFYATTTLVVDEDVVEWNLKDHPEIKDYLGKRFVATGYWSDADGLDLYDAWVEEPVVTHIPEQVTVTPAHDEITWRKVSE